MEGGSFSKWGSRLSAAHIRLKTLQQLHGSRAVPFQNGALALVPRTFVLRFCNNYTDGGRPLFKMGFPPWRRAHRLQNLQQLHGWRAGRFQNGALAVAPRASVTRIEGGWFSKWGSRNVRPIWRLSGQWGARLSRAPVQV